uniref:Uncharacterized protein n=1 Tax=Romanomermis culicivorax TaxID=13658 RepID=A0A915KCM2_ROMCU
MLIGHRIHNAHQYLKHNDFLKDKCCIIQINNTDDLRSARALVVARAYIHKKIGMLCKNGKLYKSLTRHIYCKQSSLKRQG